ncbi:MAG: hypothetical protein IAI49_01345 [Candidatus Eremiobacteraeota bacterium]|nr:hypothetical protein [Candidatus Eremiobacteraeota bacterium]
MSRELKIVLVIFGSLGGIALALVVVLALTLPHLMKTLAAAQSDPAAVARTAAKIATFNVPKGYRIGNASDLGLTQIVTIVPVRPDRGGFQMQLQGSLVPSDGSSSVRGMKLGMGLVGRFAHCDLRDGGTDDVLVRGVHLKLAVMECPHADLPFRIETGVFPGNAEQATITAMGFGGGEFDTKALHQLLASVR